MLSFIKNINISKILFNVLQSKISTDKMESFPVQQYEIGERLDRYLKKSPIGWISGQKLLRKKDIVILKQNGTITNQRNYKLEKGDVLMISQLLRDKFARNQLDESRAISRQEATIILDKMIVFDNENITILNKKNGFSVQGGLNPKKNLYSLMCSKYKKQLIHITHRLDKSTSGLVIFAKNKQTAQLVQMSMEQKNLFSKFYIAQAQGSKPITKPGYVRCNIEWTSKNKARLCNQTQQSSKDCITFYLPILHEKIKQKGAQKQSTYKNLLGIKLLTGRKHQIRCHLSQYLDQPIINDTKYGGIKTQSDEEENESIYLHAFGLIIRKREILDKILAGHNHIMNTALGTMTINQKQNTLLFTGQLPQFWDFPDKNSLKLENLANSIEKIQKQYQHEKPNKRNMTSIV